MMSNTAKRISAAVSTLVMLGIGFTWLFSSLGLKVTNATLSEIKEPIVAVERTEAEIDGVMIGRAIEMTLMSDKKGVLTTMSFGLDHRLTNIKTEEPKILHPSKFEKFVDYIIIDGENYRVEDPSSQRLVELAYNTIAENTPYKE